MGINPLPLDSGKGRAPSWGVQRRAALAAGTHVQERESVQEKKKEEVRLFHSTSPKTHPRNLSDASILRKPSAGAMGRCPVPPGGSRTYKNDTVLQARVGSGDFGFSQQFPTHAPRSRNTVIPTPACSRGWRACQVHVQLRTSVLSKFRKTGNRFNLPTPERELSAPFKLPRTPPPLISGQHFYGQSRRGSSLKWLCSGYTGPRKDT